MLLDDEEAELRQTRDSVSIRGTVKYSTIRLPAHNSSAYSSGRTEVISYENGDIYEGESAGDNRRQGLGVLKRANGDTFEGRWIDDDIPNNSNVTYASGGHYRGGLKNLLRDGVGKYNYPNGDIYDGVSSILFHLVKYSRYLCMISIHLYQEWKEGKRHGQGSITFADGNVYLGDWDYNLITGKGAN